MAKQRKSSGRKYGEAARKSVRTAVHKAKRGKLKAGAGRHGKAKSRKQAIAIGLSEARKKGAKVPARRVPPRAGARKEHRRLKQWQLSFSAGLERPRRSRSRTSDQWCAW